MHLIRGVRTLDTRDPCGVALLEGCRKSFRGEYPPPCGRGRYM